ncbi:MAG: leucine-rich repeat domain-containing protein [Paramuribaculum sp.]|nr:leucine-rich repeat domain-containing protein [Paramuribaculum sp.]
MILNILLALVSLLSDSLSEKRYWDEYDPYRTDLYDFKCDGLYYEFAGENEVNLVREKTLIIEYGWYVTDIAYLYTLAYNNVGNVGYVGDVVIPDSVEYQGKKYKVVSINSLALSYARGLNSITFTSDIPFKYPEVRYNQFRESGTIVHSRDLTTVTYYDSTTTISRQLHRCPSLKTIKFPYKLERIECSFIESGLTEVDLDNHGEYNPSRFSIEEECFRKSASLRRIKFPECDTLVFKNSSFDGCFNIEEFVLRPCSVIVQEGKEFLSYSHYEQEKCYAAVISESVVPPAVILHPSEDYNSFNGYRDRRTLFVPDESIDAYSAAYYWKDFWYIRPISEYYALEMVEIESPVADAENVSEILLDSKGAELHISVSEPTEVSVWSIQGAQVWRGRVADDTTLSLPHGMYIITTPTSTMKYSH